MLYFILAYVLWQWGALSQREWALNRGVMWANLGFGKITLLTAKQLAATMPHGVTPDSPPALTTFSKTPCKTGCGVTVLVHHLKPPFHHMVRLDTPILTQGSHAWIREAERCSQTCVWARSSRCYYLVHMSVLLGHCPKCRPLPHSFEEGLTHSSWKVGSTSVTIAAVSRIHPLKHTSFETSTIQMGHTPPCHCQLLMSYFFLLIL